MQRFRELMESALSDYVGALTEDVSFPRSVTQLSQRIGRGTQYSGDVSFQSTWPESVPAYHMVGPFCVLYTAGMYSVDNLPVRETLCKPVPFREFYDCMEAFWRQWYYPEHPEMRERLEPLMAQLKTSLGLDGPPEQDPPAPDPNLFYLEINPAPDDPDMAELLTYLAQAARGGFGAPTGLTIWAEVDHSDPATEPVALRPAFVTMTAVCPGDEIPIEDRARLRAQHREFCGRVRAYLDGSYYGRNPGREEQTEAAMAALRNALEVEES